MQANIAVGLLETSSIAKGIEALDSMCKAAGVKAIGEDAVVSRIVIPNAHEHLGAAI